MTPRAPQVPPAPPIPPAPSREGRAYSRIVVPRSALDAWPQDPDPLVCAVVDYVNFLTKEGRYNRREICPAAMQAFHTDYYLAQVLNGGHAQFVGNTRALLKPTLADLLEGLEQMRAPNYLLLVRRMTKWVDDNPDKVEEQTGFEGGIDPVLQTLDSPFFKLDRATPLRRFIATWLAGHPALEPVPDARLRDTMQQIAEENPARDYRRQILEMARIDGMMTTPPYLPLSVAAGALRPLDPIVSIGNGSYREVEGDRRMTVFMRTVSGPCWAVPLDEGVAIYAGITHDNSHLPENPFDASLDDIRKFRPDEVGELRIFVRNETIQSAGRVARDLKAGAALHALLGRLPERPALDFVTIRSAGADAHGEEGLTATLILNGAQLALSAVISEHGAHLLSEPEHDRLAELSRAEIDAHAEAHALDRLL
ncbi:DMP19 family protein [Pseudoponticoccus marisrubri]|uniref:DNA mimic protein DMP19 C-terminal domain-containing protein n=1 Tax=Pseudoponticoccus marisrubri TaxID=1685382 RepID=A0A0W7WGL8_9RHOB|nr:hypothetical protein [Pseudoponticoccus marisrubri]KUF09714.1 hypothetical protein AVJ23_16305 [Pseudoponticoccus marisrubri]